MLVGKRRGCAVVVAAAVMLLGDDDVSGADGDDDDVRSGSCGAALAASRTPTADGLQSLSCSAWRLIRRRAATSSSAAIIDVTLNSRGRHSVPPEASAARSAGAAVTLWSALATDAEPAEVATCDGLLAPYFRSLALVSLLFFLLRPLPPPVERPSVALAEAAAGGTAALQDTQ